MGAGNRVVPDQATYRHLWIFPLCRAAVVAGGWCFALVRGHDGVFGSTWSARSCWSQSDLTGMCLATNLGTALGGPIQWTTMDQNTYLLETVRNHSRLVKQHLEARDHAFSVARESGATLREVADAGGVSSTTVRRILDRTEEPHVAATVESPTPASRIVDRTTGTGRWAAPRRQPAVIRQACRPAWRRPLSAPVGA